MNVLLLVLDSLREDMVTAETMPHLNRLSEQNMSFRRCVTPANWSLPAHASLFLGEWPHEHGYYHREHTVERSPLVDSFNRRGYKTVGVSANIYVSGSHGFAREFDRFYETRRPIDPEGLNPFAHVRRLQEDRSPSPRDYAQTFVDAVGHSHPVKSIGNYLRAVGLELDRRYSLRSVLPGLSADRYGFLTRASERSISLLSELFAKHPNEDLFAFVNLMDTHYPYEPPRKYLSAATNGQITTESLKQIDPDIGRSKEFLNQYYNDGIDSTVLETVRAGYEGEVRSVDQRIGEILEILDRTGQRENTLMIVTSDHGECLGEETLRSRRGMGHYPFLSEQLWRVPLVIAHPTIRNTTVEERVSLISVSNLLIDGPKTFVQGSEHHRRSVFESDRVFFELPANPYHESTYGEYDHIPDSYIKWEVETHAVVGFDGEWRVCADSTGRISAWQGTTAVGPSTAPESLVSKCRSAVAQFPTSGETTDHTITESQKQQLEELGYL